MVRSVAQSCDFRNFQLSFCYWDALRQQPGFVDSRRRVNFYEAGSSQEEIWDDWFTLLFEVIQLDSQAIINVVASLNWCDEAHSQDTRFALKLTPELFVISIDLRTCSVTTKVHLERPGHR